MTRAKVNVASRVKVTSGIALGSDPRVGSGWVKDLNRVLNPKGPQTILTPTLKYVQFVQIYALHGRLTFVWSCGPAPLGPLDLLPLRFVNTCALMLPNIATQHGSFCTYEHNKPRMVS